MILDGDGNYNAVRHVDGDYNHRNEDYSSDWTEVCDSLADKIFQPTLRPRRSNVRPFLFHIYDPTWETPFDFPDKEFSMKVLSKYTKTTDPEVLAELYQIYGVRYAGQPIPYVRLEGVGEVLKGIDSKDARQSKPSDFVDNSPLKELEQAGLLRKLTAK